MSSISNTLMQTLEMFIGMAVTGFLVLSVVLFIVDGIKAKRQNRKRKTGIKVMFVISIVLATILAIILFALVAMIVGYVANS